MKWKVKFKRMGQNEFSFRIRVLFSFGVNYQNGLYVSFLVFEFYRYDLQKQQTRGILSFCFLNFCFWEVLYRCLLFCMRVKEESYRVSFVGWGEID